MEGKEGLRQEWLLVGSLHISLSFSLTPPLAQTLC